MGAMRRILRALFAKRGWNEIKAKNHIKRQIILYRMINNIIKK